MKIKKVSVSNVILNILSLSSLALGVSACKTTEEVRREQENVQNLNRQVGQGQELVGQLSIKNRELEERMGTLNGKIEEFQFQRDQKDIEQQKSFDSLNTELQNQRQDMNALKQRMDQVEGYIKEVLEQLKKMSAQKKSLKSDDASSTGDDFEESLKLYNTKKYSEAISLMLPLVESKKTKKTDKPRLYHNMGISLLKTNDYKNAQIYFGRLYAEFPKHALVAHGLLNLAEALLKDKQEKRAKQTLEVLLKEYKSSRYAEQASKMLKEL
jgi:TolA-binding protein